jgi:hypothetical protein
MRNANISLETTLSDGISIKLEVSLVLKSESLTTTTTITDTSLFFEIKNSQPSQHATPTPNLPSDQPLIPATMPVLQV